MVNAMCMKGIWENGSEENGGPLSEKMLLGDSILQDKGLVSIG